MRQFSQVNLPPLGPVNKILLGTWVGAFLLQTITQMATSFSITSMLALTPGRFKVGEVYQILTYPFFHVQMWDLLLHSLVLVFMGTALEGRWGTRAYSLFLLVMTLAVGGGYIFLSVLFPSLNYLPLYGAGAWLFAMATTYALMEPHAVFSLMFLFPVPAKVAVGLLLALEVYSGIFSPLKQAALANIIGAMAAYVWFKAPSWRSSGILGKKWRSSASKASRGHLRLVNTEKDKNNADRKDGPKYWQ